VVGVQVQSNLKWDSHCNEMIKKASSTIWVLRRMRALGVDRETLIQYWKAEGRVHLEFAQCGTVASLWHSPDHWRECNESPWLL